MLTCLAMGTASWESCFPLPRATETLEHIRAWAGAETHDSDFCGAFGTELSSCISLDALETHLLTDESNSFHRIGRFRTDHLGVCADVGCGVLPDDNHVADMRATGIPLVEYRPRQPEPAPGGEESSYWPRTLAWIPVTVAGRLRAILVACTREPFAYGVGELSFLTSVAEAAGPAFARATRRHRLLVEQENLRDSEERLLAVFHNSLDAIVVLSRSDGRILEVNRTVQRLLLHDPAVIVGQDFSVLFPGDFAHARDAMLERFSVQGALLPRQACVRADGAVRLMDISCSLIRWGNEKAVLATLSDVTDRHHAEVQKLMSETKLASLRMQHEAVVSGSPHGLCMLTRDWCIAFANPAFRRIVGSGTADAGSLDGRDLAEFAAHPGDFETYRAKALRTIRTHGTDVSEMEMVRADGARVWCEISMVRQDPAATASGFVATVTDISEKRQSQLMLEEQVRRLSALHMIDIAVANSVDLRVTLNVILDQVSSLLGADAADVLLLNRATGTLDFSVGRGFRTSMLQKTRLPVGTGLAGEAALHKRTVFVGDLPGDPGPLATQPLVGVEGFISYCAVPLLVQGQVVGVLEVFQRSKLSGDASWCGYLETLAGQAAIAINSFILFEGLQHANADLLVAYDSVLEGWSAALELRDVETHGHTVRVTELAVRLGRAMGLDDNDLVQLRRGSLLHDIGKMGVPDSILMKNGPLTDEEWRVIRLHPLHAHELLKSNPFLRQAEEIPYCHHEHWDGTGYPRGLAGEDIPLLARIFAVIDVWDALSSDRPYRRAWSVTLCRRTSAKMPGCNLTPPWLRHSWNWTGSLTRCKAHAIAMTSKDDKAPASHDLAARLRERVSQLEARERELERCRTEAGAMESQLHLISEYSTDMISFQTPEGCMTYVSGASRTLLGYEPEELLGRSPVEFVCADDLEQAKTLFSAVSGNLEQTLQAAACGDATAPRCGWRRLARPFVMPRPAM